MEEKIVIIGLGYVGYPLAKAFSEKYKNTIGFDIDTLKARKIKEFRTTSNEEDIKDADYYIVSVPTPVDENKNPDLSDLYDVAYLLSTVIKKGSIICFESTVYPGVTEELRKIIKGNNPPGFEFKVGYSPERINPGDNEHYLSNIVKNVSGEDYETAEKLRDLYSKIIDTVYVVPSIKIAEAAKVLENTQRDVNIALLNEAAIIFSKMGIDMNEVLRAAKTRWNYVKEFSPGLVGGHCIGVDPYYLAHAAESVGYYPEVILSCRKTNESISKYIADETIKILCKQGKVIPDLKIGIFGFSYKENVPDIRNTKVFDLVNHLIKFGPDVLVYDPIVSKKMVEKEYGIFLSDPEEMKDLDCLILAVPHDVFKKNLAYIYNNSIKRGGLLIDVRSAFKDTQIGDLVINKGITYWNL